MNQTHQPALEAQVAGARVLRRHKSVADDHVLRVGRRRRAPATGVSNTGSLVVGEQNAALSTAAAEASAMTVSGRQSGAHRVASYNSAHLCCAQHAAWQSVPGSVVARQLSHPWISACLQAAEATPELTVERRNVASCCVAGVPTSRGRHAQAASGCRGWPTAGRSAAPGAAAGPAAGRAASAAPGPAAAWLRPQAWQRRHRGPSRWCPALHVTVQVMMVGDDGAASRGAVFTQPKSQ